MSARLAFGTLVLSAALVSAATPQREYVVRWAADVEAEDALVQQVDRQLRDELRRRGAVVVEGQGASRRAIVLTTSLEVTPQALRLKLVGLRGWDRAVLGAVSARASGSSRANQLKAVVQRACLEAESLR